MKLWIFFCIFFPQIIYLNDKDRILTSNTCKLKLPSLNILWHLIYNKQCLETLDVSLTVHRR